MDSQLISSALDVSQHLSEIISVDSSKKLLLSDPNRAYTIKSGRVDVFLVLKGECEGKPLFIGRFFPRNIILGIKTSSLKDRVNIIGVGNVGTKVSESARSSLFSQLGYDDSSAGNILEIRTWLRCWLGDCSTNSFQKRIDNKWTTIEQLIITQLLEKIKQAKQLISEDKKRRQKYEIDQKIAIDKAVRVLAIDDQSSLIEKNHHLQYRNPVVRALATIRHSQGFKSDLKDFPKNVSIQTVLSSTEISARRVFLDNEWWREESDCMIAVLKDKKVPVALIYEKYKGYYWIDTFSLKRHRIDRNSQHLFEDEAYAVRSTLPDDSISKKRLLKLIFFELNHEICYVALLGVLVGLTGIAIPIGTTIIVDQTIAWGSNNDLIYIGISLVSTVFAGTFLSYIQFILLLRIEGKMDNLVVAGLWERLLRLPSFFFRNRTSGDLMKRMQGLRDIKNLLAGGLMPTLFSIPLALIYCFQLFCYDISVGFFGVLFGLASLAPLCIGPHILRLQREHVKSDGKHSGTALDLINGLKKIRIAGAEGLTFNLWSTLFARKIRLGHRVNLVTAAVELWLENLPLMGLFTLFLYTVIKLQDTAIISIGVFMGEIVAFTLLLSHCRQLSNTLLQLLGLYPMLERVTPMLNSVPIRHSNTGRHRRNIEGAISIENVSFRYAKGNKFVLQNISIDIEPGDFIAIAGPSGSGKSTLIRLLLGFETPCHGSIIYDGVALADYDIYDLRRFFGVVLQECRLITGDVLMNIAGNRPCTLEQAWEATRKAGIEKEIRSMSLGLKTFVGENGSMLSGGQRQRILIARALITNPKILLLDEATSALDNRTQSNVMDSLRRLNATTIVVAHRLSTIREADKIIYIENGQILEIGKFDELMEKRGHFFNLAKRQIG